MMRTSVFRSITLPALIATIGLATAIALNVCLEQAKPQLPSDYEDNDLSINGSKFRGYALGMEGLMADWYWMRSLQYLGGKIEKAQSDFINIDDLRDLNPRLLYPLLENATDLDPHFMEPYTYGAIVLPAIDPNKAIIIAEKGIANNPNEWRLYQHLGYIYWKLEKYDKAAESYQKGSEITGAAPFMKLMSATMKNDGGSRETARKIFQQMLDGSDDPMVRLTAKRKLLQFDSLDERDAIDNALANFKQNTGRCVNSLVEILPMLRGVHLPDGRDFRIDSANRLVDPTDAPYLLDAEKCISKPDPAKTKLFIG